MNAQLPAHLRGVWAKWNRAVEQLDALSKEILAFGSTTHAWGIRAYIDHGNGRYRFLLDPAWEANTVYRWGAIVGEIVHDYRSALDQLVSQLVILNDGTPDRRHSFPVLRDEPTHGFETMRKPGAKPSKHGPLFGISDDALAIIERCQPYQPDDSGLLYRLHSLWNTDKHQQLIPTHLIAPRPTLKMSDVLFQGRPPDRFDGNTYVVEVNAMPVGPEPSVDIEPHTPTDVAFQDGGAVVDELQGIGTHVLIAILHPASELFPGLQGVG
jgi:hypothetical protein